MNKLFVSMLALMLVFGLGFSAFAVDARKVVVAEKTSSDPCSFYKHLGIFNSLGIYSEKVDECGEWGDCVPAPAVPCTAGQTVCKEPPAVNNLKQVACQFTCNAGGTAWTEEKCANSSFCGSTKEC